ncbi:hypothetical protein VKI21_01395 [Cyanobacterium aponinum UTEX 3222]|uniref:Uncharacterized protein n=3 Tax=Cyanobacterium aponinum TaxID=379064 RepID=K9Z0G2_CYAAP|nr:hypothetical protein [Cyanobacterium aponinum]WRL42366.1 hypothetical protein VKI21_01395 [Cyanobacterium aponinum UTEX 3222]AFZ52197.1 hypothetical protein Cyan10605_0036 [Cyanobacterium aponinum PCC 10605]MBD2393005.1 hypothetical protein [Cyanobacterium aponinum FACHB-4101]MTF38155.1 hypothetical protein [Cyanobacterium aponinum 0216]PHV63937.1 hypothetical protein CSQ80_02610 [Cyanobacterium aponinum IPPAS B-1201]
MSKRRNPKKEKAERNKAYARQFRKKFSRYSSRNNKGFNRNNSKSDDNDTTETRSDSQNNQ